MAPTPKHHRAKRQPSNRSGGAARPMGQVRIVAGKFRGRKLAVPDVTGLRPTSDRVRETLFNWLQGDIAGAHCLDLFAGSGALGFEALSRYAQSVTFVENDSIAYRKLRESCHLLDVAIADSPALDANESGAHLYQGSAQSALEHWKAADCSPLFDIVFIDPPFQLACQWLMLDTIAPALIAHNALVYVEAPSDQERVDLLPPGCELLREKRFGDVVTSLIRYSKPL